MLRDDLIRGAGEAALYCGLDVRIIYRLCECRRIPFVRKGRRLYFRKSELDRSFGSILSAS